MMKRVAVLVLVAVVLILAVGHYHKRRQQPGQTDVPFARSRNLFRQTQQVDAMPAHDRRATAGLDALGYLNYLRQQSGLAPYRHSPVLERAAAAHARYLAEYPTEGHFQNHAASPLFTGRTPLDRTFRAGYATDAVQENVSTYRAHSLPMLDNNEQHNQLDGLLTAVYHRFSLLTQTADEAGVGFQRNESRIALVVNQGDSRLNRLCLESKQPESGATRVWTGVCHNKPLYAGRLPQNHYLPYIVYPQGSNARPDFHSEVPDPMPGHEITGNPVSIEFKPRGEDEPLGIGMTSFELFQGGRLVAPVHVLTSSNDPNRLLNDHQFALFPLQPLDYDTEYRAVFRYIERGEEKTAEWHFRTKRPDFPWFDMRGRQAADVAAGRVYFIRWRGAGCLKSCPALHYRQAEGSMLEIVRQLPDGLLIRPSGRGQISLYREDRPGDILELSVK